VVTVATATTSGCVGFVYDDFNLSRGGDLYGSDGGQTWTAEAGRDLRFATSVAS
jgi:hypothetical protein